MKKSNSLVLVIEDKASRLSTLRRLLQAGGYRVQSFSSLADVRKVLADTDRPSCAVVDLDLPRGTGQAVQRFLGQTHPGTPVIFISSHADVPSSVEVMKAGALDLLITPLNEQRLLKLVHDAVLQERQTQRERHELAKIRERLDTLTRREGQVLECLLRGLLNKQTAAELGTSEKTIKVHRGRIMRKMGVRSIAELVQLVMRFRSAPASAAHPQARIVRLRARSVGPLVN